MSSGYSAHCADVVNEDCIKNLCKEAWDDFIKIFNEFDVDIDLWAQEVVYGGGSITESGVDSYVLNEKNMNVDDLVEIIDSKYCILTDDFYFKTGMRLSIDYHDYENGSHYDDITGTFWTVEDAYKPTEALENFLIKFPDGVLRKFFCSYG